MSQVCSSLGELISIQWVHLAGSERRGGASGRAAGGGAAVPREPQWDGAQDGCVLTGILADVWPPAPWQLSFWTSRQRETDADEPFASWKGL